MSRSGWVFNIQRFSLHDGPGIRTTVFLKGCPLRCQWCHNPEGLTSQPQVRLSVNLCTRCGRCVAACPQGGHEVTAEGHALHLDSCTRCGACAEACFAGALEIVGQRMTVGQVLDVVRRDVPFYEQSCGGMTLSGGEPLAQYAFSKALLEAAKAEQMHTAVETTVHAQWEKIAALAPLVDLFLVDLKHTDDARHRQLTGVSNKRILANIGRLAAAELPFTLRIPWVPQRNAEEALLTGLLNFLAELPQKPSVEFMPYHRLGLSKWSALGGESTIPAEIPAATADDIAPWMDALQAAGVEVRIS